MKAVEVLFLNCKFMQMQKKRKKFDLLQCNGFEFDYQKIISCEGGGGITREYWLENRRQWGARRDCKLVKYVWIVC